MVCIYCDGKTSVTNSRPQKRTNGIWRRRQCLSCKAIFTSVESADLETAILVTTTSGHSEPFSRDKLLLSVYDGLRHRKTAVRDASALTDTIINMLVRQSAQLSTMDIVKTVGKVLANFDNAASVHYQAFHTKH